MWWRKLRGKTYPIELTLTLLSHRKINMLTKNMKIIGGTHVPYDARSLHY